MFALALGAIAFSPHLGDGRDPGAAFAEKLRASNVSAYTPAAFEAAKAVGEPFLLVFFLENCAICAEQSRALNQVYAMPEFADLKVLVVDFGRDYEALRRFGVGQQSVLIYFDGGEEVSRTAGLTRARDIVRQLNG